MKIFFLAACIVVMVIAGSLTDYKDTNWGGGCDGIRQSPINIKTQDVQFCPWTTYLGLDGKCQDFFYNETGQALTVDAKGLTWLYTTKFIKQFSQAQFRLYSSLQFHYHAPSEHTIDGKYFDLEMHLVHTISDETETYIPKNTDQINYKAKTDGNQLAVIGILFEEDAKIEEDIFDRFPDKDGMANLLASFEFISKKYFFNYQGSLTTPPCTETVEWFVMKQSLPIRPQNLNRFRNDLNNGQPNNRPVQDIFQRKVGIISAANHCQYYNQMRLKYYENNAHMNNHTMN